MAICELIPQAGGFRDADIAPGAGLAANKLIHLVRYGSLLIPKTTVVTAVTTPIAIIQATTAEVVSAQACVFTAATGDHTIHIDIQRSTAGGAFATMMTSTIAFNNTVLALTPIEGVFSTVTLVAGDILQAVVTVAGSTSTQGSGLLLTLATYERPTT